MQMLINLAKEILFFIALFLVLSFAIHADGWLTAPIELTSNLGVDNHSWHPLIYSLCLYAIIRSFKLVEIAIKRFVK